MSAILDSQRAIDLAFKKISDSVADCLFGSVPFSLALVPSKNCPYLDHNKNRREYSVMPNAFDLFLNA